MKASINDLNGKVLLTETVNDHSECTISSIVENFCNEIYDIQRDRGEYNCFCYDCETDKGCFTVVIK